MRRLFGDLREHLIQSRNNLFTDNIWDEIKEKYTPSGLREKQR